MFNLLEAVIDMVIIMVILILSRNRIKVKGKRLKVKGSGFLVPDLPALNKLVFPQIGEKFLPGNGQDAVGKGAYRVLADQD